ncbi:hypothetical protein AB0H28_00855 [Micromonospora sp. NPDC050980]|uniref:hypothetical protein n=1 Tax=Micromonospora sp. NPDC050980 TaxID=3155161 RepID=UPI0033CDBBE9
MRGLIAHWRAWRATHRRAVRLARRLVLVAAAGVVLLAVATVASAVWIRGEAAGHVFTATDVPDAPVALVLGAGVKAAVDVLSRRDPVHLGRRETGVDDALRAG